MFMRREFIQGIGLVAAIPAAASARPDHAGGASGDIAPPPAHFASNHNYTMCAADAEIRGLSVTVHVEEDIVAPTGMSFQLNVHSPKDSDCYWQQYMLRVMPVAGKGLQIGWSIENWGTKKFVDQLIGTNAMTCRPESVVGDSCKNQPVVNEGDNGFATYANVANDTVPAGFKLRFDLVDDESGQINAVKFTVTNKGGRETTSGPLVLTSYPLFRATNKNKHAPDTVLARNAGFQMEIVGFNKGASTVMSSGAGKIVYEATTPLHPVGDFGETQTAETSNLVYSELPAAAKKKIAQTFGLNSRPQPECSVNEAYNPATKQCTPATGGTTKVRNKPGPHAED
jgi:hypothetical protein